MITSTTVRPTDTFGPHRTLPQRRAEVVMRVISRGVSVASQLPLAALAGAVLSLAFAAAVPSVGIGHGLHEGAWRGVLLHGWPAPHAHTAYPDLGLALGVVGLVLAWTLFMVVLRGIAILRSRTSPAAVWPLAFLAFILLYEISESALLNIKYSILCWVLYLTVMTAQPAGVRWRLRHIPSRRSISLPQRSSAP